MAIVSVMSDAGLRRSAAAVVAIVSVMSAAGLRRSAAAVVTWADVARAEGAERRWLRRSRHPPTAEFTGRAGAITGHPPDGRFAR